MEEDSYSQVDEQLEEYVGRLLLLLPAHPREAALPEPAEQCAAVLLAHSTRKGLLSRAELPATAEAASKPYSLCHEGTWVNIVRHS